MVREKPFFTGLVVCFLLFPLFSFAAKESGLASKVPEDALSGILYTWVNEASFEDPSLAENNGKVAMQEVDGTLLLPLYGDEGDDLLFLGGPAFKWNRLDFSNVDYMEDEDLYTLTLPMNLVYQGFDRWVLWGGVVPGLFSDLRKVNSRDYKTQGHALALYGCTPAVNVAFGAAYDSSFGDDELYPLGGFTWNIGDKWALWMVLPQPAIVWAPTDKLAFFLGLRPAGDKWNMHTEDGGSEYDFKIETMRLGAGFEYALTKHIWFHLAAGGDMDRKYTLENDDGALLESGADDAFFVRGGIVLR